MHWTPTGSPTTCTGSTRYGYSSLPMGCVMHAPVWTHKTAARHRATAAAADYPHQHGSHERPHHHQSVYQAPGQPPGALLIPRAAGMGCPRLPDGSRPHPTACGPTPPHPGAAGRRACSARCARYASVPRGSAQAPPSYPDRRHGGGWARGSRSAHQAPAQGRSRLRRCPCGAALPRCLAARSVAPSVLLGPRPLYDSGPGAIVGLRSAPPGTLRRAGASLA